MSADAARVAERPASLREVWVNKLCGGPHLKGSLVDLGSTGACVILDRPLERGEVIRLSFPRTPGAVRYQGQTIIGQVLHSRGVPGRHVVGVAFGWSTGFKRKWLLSLPKTAWWSWLRDCCRREKLRTPVPARKA